MSFFSRWLSGGLATVAEDVRDKLRASVMEHEGCRLMADRDPLGILTIGYGHNLQTADVALHVKLVDEAGGDETAIVITQDTADRLLDNDLACAEDDVRRALPWAVSLDPCRKAVLVEMAFQLGIGGLLRFVKMLRAARRGDHAEAAAQMLDSTWHHQTPARVETLAGRMRSGEWA